MSPIPWDYLYYVQTVVRQWALWRGFSGANSISVRAWLRQPDNARWDFRCMIRGAGCDLDRKGD